ncbi:nuclear transport factor 2 family protein [Lacinutrix neustonica]|uniref:Nuclear transport factor 2 family protein n=1 Tax=Lacinutrix neustonica TaxID=2980107 RepID=A0A9E8MX17_9FLAO|nr:nuclear transport factor 2 family protein [Lacinutrix neustonica]WAC03247.1 nuclear transport factor 2 family protein [Lacinutrix neustonica]
MKSIKTIITTTLFLGLCYNVVAQASIKSELFITLKQSDSLLFNNGFNTCDIKPFETLIADDFEFYHDQSGVTSSKEVFIIGIKDGLCNAKNTIKSRRELVNGSLSVYPLYSKGVLYGAIQKGEHQFYESQEGQPEQKASLAKFTHLWIKTENNWQLKRVLSYDHTIKKEPKTENAKVSQDLLESYTGHYNAKTSGLVVISKTEKGLHIKAGKMDADIFPKTETLFTHQQAPLTFEFISDSQGHIEKFIVRENNSIVEEAIKQ